MKLVPIMRHHCMYMCYLCMSSSAVSSASMAFLPSCLALAFVLCSLRCLATALSPCAPPAPPAPPAPLAPPAAALCRTTSPAALNRPSIARRLLRLLWALWRAALMSWRLTCGIGTGGGRGRRKTRPEPRGRCLWGPTKQTSVNMILHHK